MIHLNTYFDIQNTYYKNQKDLLQLFKNTYYNMFEMPTSIIKNAYIIWKQHLHQYAKTPTITISNDDYKLFKRILHYMQKNTYLN